jgi:hypothetical protein
MRFTWMWRRVRTRLAPGSPPELKEWAARLQAALAAELPPTMDAKQRARLVLELVDAMRQAEAPGPGRGVPAGPVTHPVRRVFRPLRLGIAMAVVAVPTSDARPDCVPVEVIVLSATIGRFERRTIPKEAGGS